MKKILSLLLVSLLLLAALPFAVSATEKNAFGEGSASDLLTPKNESYYISDGLIFEGASNEAIVAEDALTVIDRTMDASSMLDYSYDFTVMTSMTINEEAGEHLIMSLSVLDIYATVDASGTVTAFRASVGDASLPIKTDELPETPKVGEPLYLTVVASLKPSFADDGVMNRCQFSLGGIYLKGFPLYDLNEENALSNLRMAGIETKTCKFGADAEITTNAALVYERELTGLELSANSIFMLCVDEGVTELHNTDYFAASTLQDYVYAIFEELSSQEHTADTLKATVDEAYELAIASDDTYDYTAWMIAETESDADIAHNALLTAAEEEDFLLADYFTLSEEDRLSLLDEIAAEGEFSEEIYDTYIGSYLPETPDLSSIENAMKDVISFVGYQARIDGVSAVRALFKVDIQKLAALETAGYTVSYGTTLVLGEAKTVETVYGEGATCAPVYNGKDEIRFATMLEAESSDRYGDAYSFGAFLTVKTADATYTLLISAGGSVLGNPISMQEICTYFSQNGFADAPAISRVVAN